MVSSFLFRNMKCWPSRPTGRNHVPELKLKLKLKLPASQAAAQSYHILPTSFTILPLLSVSLKTLAPPTFFHLPLCHRHHSFTAPSTDTLCSPCSAFVFSSHSFESSARVEPVSLISLLCRSTHQSTRNHIAIRSLAEADITLLLRSLQSPSLSFELD